MRNDAIDLRRGSLLPLLLGLPAVLGVLALSIPAMFDTAHGTGSRMVAALFSVAFGLGLLLLLSYARERRRPLRLVIDHEGIRIVTSRPKPMFRVLWTELAGVGVLLRKDRERERAENGRGLAPLSWTSVGVVLELIPVDAATVQRHPELRRAWVLGKQQLWSIGLGVPTGAPFPIEEMVLRRRPDLWRGERSGSPFAR